MKPMGIVITRKRSDGCLDDPGPTPPTESGNLDQLGTRQKMEEPPEEAPARPEQRPPHGRAARSASGVGAVPGASAGRRNR